MLFPLSWRLWLRVDQTLSHGKNIQASENQGAIARTSQSAFWSAWEPIAFNRLAVKSAERHGACETIGGVLIPRRLSQNHDERSSLTRYENCTMPFLMFFLALFFPSCYFSPISALFSVVSALNPFLFSTAADRSLWPKDFFLVTRIKCIQVITSFIIQLHWEQISRESSKVFKQLVILYCKKTYLAGWLHLLHLSNCFAFPAL